MRKPVLFAFAAIFFLFTQSALLAQPASSGVVVLSEPGFPASDSAAPDALATISGAQSLAADHLRDALAPSAAHLLILPYGSAFPEEAWPAIKQFLDRGGNLLVLGGMPFTRAAYHDSTGWHLRDYSVRFIRPLMIDQYQDTPGSDGLQFQPNPELPLQLPAFAWKRAFSPVIRLSAVDLYHRGGAAGSIDARLDTLAWGVKDGRKLSAPVLQIDHYRNGFDGGRWIFVNAELSRDFFNNAALVQSLVNRALQGAEEFTVRPGLPLYLHGEPVELQVQWHAAVQPNAPVSLKITTFPEAQPANRSTVTATPGDPVVLPSPEGKGLYIIEAQLLEGDRVRALYHSAFWIRDESYLRSGPHLGINHDYFELDGHPLAVVGTTYMSSEVQRLYFEHPNVYVWNQDLAQIHDAGLNMIRTGWWSGWDKFSDEDGQPYERTLRTARSLPDDRPQVRPARAVQLLRLSARRPRRRQRFPRSPGRPPPADSDLVRRRPLPRRALPRVGSHQRAEFLAAPLEDTPQRRLHRTRRLERVAELSAIPIAPSSPRSGMSLRAPSLAQSRFRAKKSSLPAACTPAQIRCA